MGEIRRDGHCVWCRINFRRSESKALSIAKDDGLFDRMNGIGAHEVIVESPDHMSTLATLPQKSVEEMLWACRDRILDLKNDRRFRYILLFKNHGEPAGASIEHTHSQLIALPIVPTTSSRGSRLREDATITRKSAASSAI